MGDYKTLRIKDWALEDRPREKLLNKGISSLSDAELIAILIGSGTKNETAVELAKKILNTVGNSLNELGKLSVEELKKSKGIGSAKAITIIAALELGRRRKLADIQAKKKITGSKDVFNYFQPLIGDLPHEEFWILLLNRSNRVIEKHRISQGGISGTIIDVRMILKNAIEKLASSLILCHNHPSGNLQPSDSDMKITSKMKDAGKIMDIQVLDHLIVTDSAYFSFADEGIL
ncbi:MAG: DNA repair protein RadC [Bacteroidales bacterium]|nr:MAG: DNA repair protein RadC [Bacteroidales bacterium]